MSFAGRHFGDIPKVIALDLEEINHSFGVFVTFGVRVEVLIDQLEEVFAEIDTFLFQGLDICFHMANERCKF